MTKIYLFILLFSIFFIPRVFSQNIFQLSFGGLLNEYTKCVIPLSNGGYLICGYTTGFDASNYDIFLAKTDVGGNLLWFKRYGHSNLDVAYNVIETYDGGFAMAGTLLSGPLGSDDIVLIKTDSSGTIEWQKAYGSFANDQGYDIRQTPQGDYLIAGFTTNTIGANYEAYVLKISSVGNVIWSEIFGGANNEGVYTIDFAANGNYVFGGKSEMNSNGQADYLLTEMDTVGNIIWMKNYGGAGYEVAMQIRRTLDNGYILSGYSDSYISNLSYDLLAVKTDSSGNLIWAKDYHQTGVQYSGGVQQTEDGNFYFTGCTYVNGTYDVFLLKTDSAGNTDWANTYQHGSTLPYNVFNIHESNHQYLCFGGYTTTSSNDDDALVVVSDLEGNTLCPATSATFVQIDANDLVESTPIYSSSTFCDTHEMNFSENDYDPQWSLLCLPTAMNELKDSTLSIFLIGDEIHIDNNFSHDKLSLTVFNTLGQEEKVESSSLIASVINLSDMMSGIYFVEVISSHQMVSKEVLLNNFVH